MKKISKLDWFVYRLFYWRWNKIFQKRPDMAIRFANHILNDVAKKK
jgi:hypothetical protein